MEQGIREFLKRILNGMSVVLIWMLINATAGIKFNLAFPDNKIKIGNIIFYLWFIGSLVWLIRYLIKIWNKPVNIDQ